MESEHIWAYHRNWRQIHLFSKKTKQKIKPCIETTVQRKWEKTAAYRYMVFTQTYGSRINLPFTTQIIPGNFGKWANASGLQEMNSNLQMNSELMCKYKLAAPWTVSPFFLCMFHDTHCPHPSLSLNGKKELHMLMQCLLFSCISKTKAKRQYSAKHQGHFWAQHSELLIWSKKAGLGSLTVHVYFMNSLQ